MSCNQVSLGYHGREENRMLTLDTRLCPKEEEIAADVLDGEAIIINLATGSYYAMNNVGALVWRSIEQHCSLNEICARVADGYDVSIERARVDLLALATRLLDEGVVRISDAPDAAGPGPTSAQRLAYQTPELSAYSDMRNLLAMDPPMPSVDALGTPGKGGPPRP
jgi:hypothetical protein